MIPALLLGTVLSVVPLGVVAALWAGYDRATDRAPRPSEGVALMEASFLLVAGTYLLARGRPLAFLELGPVAPWHAALVVGFPVAMAGLAKLQGLVADRLGVEIGDATDEDYSVPAMVAVALLLIGPAEELLYRGVVQALFVDAVGPAVGVGLMALLFGAVHYPSYGADSPADVDLGVLLGTAGSAVAGAVLGVYYLVAGTLVVPVVAHSVYDALLFWYGARD